MSKILVAFGSLTGNTQMVAERISDYFKSQGYVVTIQNIGELNPNDLLSYEILLLGTSTWDDGQPQVDAQGFIDQCAQNPVDLNSTRYATFGCGDSSYTTFCSAVDMLSDFLKNANSKQLSSSLKIDGFPEMPENIIAIEQWCKKISEQLK